MRWAGRGTLTKSSEWPRWARHWDPHPMCWLGGVLGNPPYRHDGLGMRPCPGGGVAVTLPRTDLLIGTGPVDHHRVTWEVHTHDPDDPDGHEPVSFGRFTWTDLTPDGYDSDAGVFRLRDGSILRVPDGRSGNGDGRFRIECREEPGRLIPATDTWADLAAIEQIASRIHDWLSDGQDGPDS